MIKSFRIKTFFNLSKVQFMSTLNIKHKGDEKTKINIKIPIKIRTPRRTLNLKEYFISVSLNKNNSIKSTFVKLLIKIS